MNDRRKTKYGKWIRILVGILLLLAIWQFMRIQYRARMQRLMVERVYRHYGEALYDFQIESDGKVDKSARPPIPDFLIKWLGVDFFCDVTHCFLVDPSNDVPTKELLSCFPGLQRLRFKDTPQFLEEEVPYSALKNCPNLRDGNFYNGMYLSMLRSNILIEDIEWNEKLPISRFKNLRTLRIFDEWEGSESLRSLPIKNLYIWVEGFERFQAGEIAPSVRKLVISGNGSIETNWLKNLEGLVELELDSLKFSKNDPVVLPKGLKSFTYRGDWLTATSFQKCKDSLRRLYLDFDDTKKNDFNVKELFEGVRFPKLTSLELGEKPFPLSEIKKVNFPALKTIHIKEFAQIPASFDSSFPAISAFVCPVEMNWDQLSSLLELNSLRHLSTCFYSEDFQGVEFSSRLESLHLHCDAGLYDLDSEPSDPEVVKELQNASKSIRDSLGRSGSLRWLEIPHFYFDNLDFLKKHNNLKGLSLGSFIRVLKLDKQIKQTLVEKSNLEQLVLCNTECNDWGFLSGLKNLKVLGLSDEKTNDFRSFPVIPKLDYLCLKGMNFESLEGIERFPELTTVVFHNCQVQDASKLEKLKKLREIYWVTKDQQKLPAAIRPKQVTVIDRFEIDGGITITLDNPNLSRVNLADHEDSFDYVFPGPEFVRKFRAARYRPR